jgi:hypothetical protein
VTDAREIRATLVASAAVLLTGTALHSVFGGWRWWGPVLVATAVGMLSGTVSRRVRLPLALQPLLGAAVLLVVCTARFASTEAFAGVVPTRASWAQLRQLYSYGLHDVTASTPPVHATQGAMLLATLGVGLVAIAVDLVAVSADRPSLAGIPLLALIVIPASAESDGIGIWSFLLAGLGYLALLASEMHARQLRWGRSLRGDPSGARLAEVAAGSTGWRISVVALGVALLVPLAIPGADHRPFRGGSGSGSSSTTVVNPLVQMSADLHDQRRTDLLTVHTDTPTYLRLTALEQFGANGFTLRQLTAGNDAKVSHGLPAPQTGSERIATMAVRERVNATGGLDERFLPVPQSPTEVNVDGDWRLAQPTGTIFSSRTTTRDKIWTVSAAVPAPSVAVLRAAGTPDAPSTPYGQDLDIDLTVPDGLPSVVEQTAHEWAAQAGATTSYDIAAAIQAQLTGPTFSYDLNPGIGPGLDGFRQFLQIRRGFCEQYASTMVAMLRTMGIPARVAVGFTTGTQQTDGSYLVTNQNAHAWPEVWFATAGWVRFEPTPLTDGTADVPSWAPAGGGGTDGQSNPDPTPTPSTSTSDGASTSASATPTAGASATDGGSTGSGGVALLVLLVLLVVAALLCVPTALVALRRGRRWRRAGSSGTAAAVVAWAQVIEDATDRGVAVPASASPRRTARAVLDRGTGPDGRRPRGLQRALAVLVAGVEQARYAPGEVETTSQELREAALVVRRALTARLSRRQRVLVLLAPTSFRTMVAAPVRFIRAGYQWSTAGASESAGP